MAPPGKGLIERSWALTFLCIKIEKIIKFRPPSTNSDDSDGWDEKESSTEDVQFLHEKMESLMKKERIRTESQSRGDFNEEEDRKVRLEYFDKLRKDCESDSRDSSPTFVSDDDTDEEIMKDHDSIFYKFLTLESRNGQFMTRQKTEHKTAKNSDAAYLLLQVRKNKFSGRVRIESFSRLYRFFI